MASRRRAQSTGGEASPFAGVVPGHALVDLIGHGPAVASLRRQLSSQALSHAYWLSGPPQVGKTTLALAAAAEFLDAANWPGGLLAHPDLWLDDGAGTLGIDRIRTPDSDADSDLGPPLQHFLSRSSFAGRGKVAVIGNAERLSLPAANSLLRLLEEPAPNTMIWLCTSRPDSEHLPNTLRSRCQQQLLGPVETATIRNWLIEAHGVVPEAARVAAAICLGRPGLGLEMAQDQDLERLTRERLDSFSDCAGRGPAGWLELSRQLAERGTDRGVAVGALRVWASFLRDCCCLAAGAPEQARLAEPSGPAQSWASSLGLSGCSKRYDLALDSLSRLDELATPRLVLDRFLLRTFGGNPPSPPVSAPQAARSESDQR